MTIREDLVASAAKFLQDPSVAASSADSRVAFLKAKNLTPEEVSAALARAGLDTPSSSVVSSPSQPSPPVPFHPQQQQQQQQQQPPQFYNQPPYGWQPPPPPPETAPRRDWRDWFIMATVVGGVGYGLYSMTKRYVYPLVAPPTPDRLEQDKKAIDEQFERAFALVDQLAKDTDELKSAEKERTERLDSALTNLEGVISELKTTSKRREEDAERLRDDVRGLKDALPKALDTQREVTDGRLREVNTELKGLRTLIGQRMSSSASATAPATTNGYSAATNGGVASYLRPSSVAASTASAPSVVSVDSDADKAAAESAAAPAAPAATTSTAIPFASASANSGSSLPLSAGRSIPAWQRAMKPAAASVAPASGTSSPATTPAVPEASGSA